MHDVVHRLVQRGDEPVVQGGIDRDRRPLRAAVGARQHARALVARQGEHVLLRDEAVALAHELARLRVENVHPARLAGVHDDLLPAQAGHDRRRDRVEVPDVVRDRLVVPLRLARARVDGHHAVGVEVVARPDAAVEVGGRVADREEDGVALLVVCRRHPHAAAAAGPGVGVLGAVALLLGDVAVQVGAVWRLRRPGAPPAVGGLVVEGAVAFRRGDRVPAPHLVARHGIVGGDGAPDAVFAPGDADDHVVADDEGSVGDAVPEGGIGDFLVPHDLAVFGAERDQVGIQRSHVQMGAAVNGHAAIVGAAAEDGGAQLVLVPPELLLGGEVVGYRRIVRGGDVHDAVGDDRGVLERAQLGNPGLENHPGDQLRYVGGRDRFESGVPLVPIVAAVRRPIATLGRSLTCRGEEHRGHPPTRAHAHGLFLSAGPSVRRRTCGGPWKVGRKAPPTRFSPVSAINRRERSPGDSSVAPDCPYPADAWGSARGGGQLWRGIGAVGQPPCGGVDRGR